MNKKEFIEYFSLEDKNSMSHIFEKYELTNYGIKGITEEFYSPLIWTKLIEIQNKLGVKVDTNGYFSESERRVISFTGDECFGDDKDNIKLLEIKNMSKFKELGHKDYLGGLMSLGLKREKFGDMVVKGEICYTPTFQNIGDFVINELKVIGRNPVEINFSEETQVNPNFEDLNLIIASNRLDAIVAAITKLSREESIKKIEKGEVTLNYLIVKEKSTKVRDNSTISIKYFGKYKFMEKLGETKKDKLRIGVKKYI